MINIRELKYILIIVFFLNCTQQKNDIVELSNLPADNAIDIPFEISGLKTSGNEDVLIAKFIKDPNQNFVVQRGSSIFAENDASKNYSFSTILESDLPEGKYQISPYKTKPELEFEENENGQLTILENRKPALTYNYGMQLGNDVPERYRRSSYIHPIYDLKGNILTDDFPDDHFHHRGLSWMWPKVFIDSVRYDLWHIYGQEGELEGIHQVFEKWLKKEAGPICATFGVKNIWQLDSGQKVMDEWVYVKVYNANKIARAIDIKLVFKANVEICLEGQTKKGYGGLNFRFAPRIETTITSQFGKEEDSDLKSLPWADQSAIFGDTNYFSGVSIFQQKSNNNFPAGWCLRHYGFLGVAWPGVVRYYMNPEETFTLSFRIWVHQGNAEQGLVENAFKVFNNPPIIKYE